MPKSCNKSKPKVQRKEQSWSKVAQDFGAEMAKRAFGFADALTNPTGSPTPGRPQPSQGSAPVRFSDALPDPTVGRASPSPVREEQPQPSQDAAPVRFSDALPDPTVGRASPSSTREERHQQVRDNILKQYTDAGWNAHPDWTVKEPGLFTSGKTETRYSHPSMPDQYLTRKQMEAKGIHPNAGRDIVSGAGQLAGAVGNTAGRLGDTARDFGSRVLGGLQGSPQNDPFDEPFGGADKPPAPPAQSTPAAPSQISRLGRSAGGAMEGILKSLQGSPQNEDFASDPFGGADKPPAPPTKPAPSNTAWDQALTESKQKQNLPFSTSLYDSQYDPRYGMSLENARKAQPTAQPNSANTTTAATSANPQQYGFDSALNAASQGYQQSQRDIYEQRAMQAAQTGSPAMAQYWAAKAKAVGGSQQGLQDVLSRHRASNAATQDQRYGVGERGIETARPTSSRSAGGGQAPMTPAQYAAYRAQQSAGVSPQRAASSVREPVTPGPSTYRVNHTGPQIQRMVETGVRPRDAERFTDIYTNPPNKQPPARRSPAGPREFGSAIVMNGMPGSAP